MPTRKRTTPTPTKPTDTHVYEFPAIKGIQAGREYYTCMVPISVLAKIFMFDEEEVPVELRAQRTLNESRANKIRDYVIENPKGYVLPALTASIDGDMEFKAVEERGALSDVGTLRVPIASKFLINDGQHRKAGLAKALADDPDLQYESIAVVFFWDIGLKRSQQIFSDINRNAKAPDASINMTFDHRDPWANLTREVIKAVPFLRMYTQNEGGSIKKTSGKLLLRKWVYDANKKLCESLTTERREAYAIAFWNALVANIPEWQQIQDHKLNAFDVRTEYVSGCAIALTALSQIGSELAFRSELIEHPEKLSEVLAPLSGIDWHKLASDWYGMVVEPGTGKMMVKAHNLELLEVYLKEKLKAAK